MVVKGVMGGDSGTSYFLSINELENRKIANTTNRVVERNDSFEGVILFPEFETDPDPTGGTESCSAENIISHQPWINSNNTGSTSMN